MGIRLILLFVAAAIFATAPFRLAIAHEINPAVADISANSETLNVRIDLNAEAILAGIGPEHDDTDNSPQSDAYDRLRALSPDAFQASFMEFADTLALGIMLSVDGQPVPMQVTGIATPEIGDLKTPRQSILTLTAPMPPNANTVSFGWAAEFGTIVVRAAAGDFATMLTGGDVTAPFAIDNPVQGFWPTLMNYVAVGFDHIIPKGLDHILFVIGLFLLSTQLRPLLWQVTAFTLAHTVTLALGMLGILSIPPEIVEPIIAASIVYVAIENILSPQMSRWRPAFVFGFGLLHGLGFAGVLTEFGIPEAQFAAGLIGFNIGVELGQLAVIAICFALVGYWFGNRAWYRSVVVVPGSIIVAAVGVYWVLERTVF